MQTNVAQLMKASIGTVRNYEFADEPVPFVEGEPPLVASGRARFMRTDKGILVQGRFSTRLPSECGRCLEPFDRPASVAFEEEFFPTIDIITGERAPRPDDRDAFLINANHILDLAPTIREYLLLNEPMNPICRPDCAGLCPECGQNLNQQPCPCAPRSADPRLAALEALAHTLDTAESPAEKG